MKGLEIKRPRFRWGRMDSHPKCIFMAGLLGPESVPHGNAEQSLQILHQRGLQFEKNQTFPATRSTGWAAGGSLGVWVFQDFKERLHYGQECLSFFKCFYSFTMSYIPPSPLSPLFYFSHRDISSQQAPPHFLSCFLFVSWPAAKN